MRMFNRPGNEMPTPITESGQPIAPPRPALPMQPQAMQRKVMQRGLRTRAIAAKAGLAAM